MVIGRPKEFDREAALEKAMELFWIRGYEATGLRDLLQVMGIGRQSLYDTFGDKHSLFLEAVGHYRQRVIRELLQCLETSDSPLAGIQATLNCVAESASDGKCRGCFLTNTLVELAPHDDQIAGAVGAILLGIERGFRDAVKRAMLAGELPAGADERSLSRFLTSTLQGLTVMGRAGASRATLRDIVRVAMSVLEP